MFANEYRLFSKHVSHGKGAVAQPREDDLHAYGSGQWCGLPTRRITYAMVDANGRSLIHLTKLPEEPEPSDFGKLSVEEYEKLAARIRKRKEFILKAINNGILKK
ncbi:unnamed protein product [Sympodiomycopsis kandeliae]